MLTTNEVPIMLAAGVVMLVLLALTAGCYWTLRYWSEASKRLEKSVAEQLGITPDALYERWASSSLEFSYYEWLRAQLGEVDYLRELDK